MASREVHRAETWPLYLPASGHDIGRQPPLIGGDAGRESGTPRIHRRLGLREESVKPRSDTRGSTA